MATNIIKAKLGCPDVTVWSDWAWQYDYGQILQLDGVDLPQAYEVHFSNQETGGTTITQLGDADGVTVPDELFLSGEDIFVWVFLHAGLDDGETAYKIVIPVKDRPQPSDEEPTPVEQSEITQAIAALNQAVEDTQEAQAAAEAAQEAAETAQGKAEDAQAAAEADADLANQYKTQAGVSADNALAYATAADWSAQQAASSALEAKGYKDDAEDAADRAEQSAAVSGYMWFWIDDLTGHLLMDKTPNVEVDFSLGNDGHLYVED